MKKIPTQEELVKDIEQHLDATGIAHTKFGRDVLNDSSAIDRLRKGVDPRLSTVRKIYNHITKWTIDNVIGS